MLDIFWVGVIVGLLIAIFLDRGLGIGIMIVAIVLKLLGVV